MKALILTEATGSYDEYEENPVSVLCVPDSYTEAQYKADFDTMLADWPRGKNKRLLARNSLKQTQSEAFVCLLKAQFPSIDFLTICFSHF